MSESTFHGARVLAPYDPNEPQYATPITITLGANKNSSEWEPSKKGTNVETLFAGLFLHQEKRAKDGPAFVCGAMIPGPRAEEAITAMHLMAFDFDRGTNPEVIDAAFLKSGCAFFRYTSFSNGKTRSDFMQDDVTKFLKCEKEDLNSEALQRYVREKEKWVEEIVSTVELVEIRRVSGSGGVRCFIRHGALHKNRVVVPMAAPFKIDDFQNLRAAKEEWKGRYLAFAQSIGLLDHIDRTGADLNRLFYFPRHPKGAPYETVIAGGTLLDWRTLTPLLQTENRKSKREPKTPEGKKLLGWARKCAGWFLIVDAIEAHQPDKLRGQGSAGFNIECPFGAEHSNGEMGGCFAVNPDESATGRFVISCRHNGCADYTNTDMLAKMIADPEEWFGKEVLTDENFLGSDPDAPESAERVQKEEKAKEGYKQAVDALNDESSDEEIDEAIMLCLEARLNLRSLEAVQNKMAKAIGANVSTVRKMFKQASIEMRAERMREEKAPGIELFTYNGEYNFHDAVKVCVIALKNANEKAKRPLFSHYEGTPVRLDLENGRVQFVPMNRDDLWSELNERIAFVRKSDATQSAHGKVPEDVAKHFHAQARNKLPEAPEVLYTPAYNSKGDLLLTDGYHVKPERDVNHLVILDGLQVPPVSEKPTLNEAEAARDWIMTNLLGDFPFLDIDEEGNEKRAPSEANALAYLITPFMRRMIPGNTPLYMIVKPSPGTGATFLAELGMKLYGGMRVATAPINYTSSPEEMEKKIVSAIREGRSHMFFDNVREFNNPVLLGSLTSGVVGGRVLSTNVNLHKPNTFIWVATGIAPKIGGEMYRRACWIRLNNKLPRGEKRKYRHKNFSEFLEENRGLAIHHILTMIEYWHSIGAPEFKKRELPSFEDWSRKVGGVLLACGVKGFLDSPAPVILDPESASDDAFLRAMHDKFKGRYASVIELFEWAGPDGAQLGLAMAGKIDERQRNFVEALRRLDGVTFADNDGDSFQLRAKHDDSDGVVFGIVPVEEREGV